ncbi:hypothetical protein VQ643_14970 [Pseudomonas sp. F1_0610]|uniref:hypothetical protein n=1 Tax=Pseudomonas sp. F1_0610 TaxID=3114284 RepID=UPI0039C45AEE
MNDLPRLNIRFINNYFAKGYSVEEIKNIEYLYNVNINPESQFYSFLYYYGRTSTLAFLDNPFLFYKAEMHLREHIIFQYETTDKLRAIQYYETFSKKGFFISCEESKEYFFILTDSYDCNSVYCYDACSSMVINTGLTLEGYILSVINKYELLEKNIFQEYLQGDIISI